MKPREFWMFQIRGKWWVSEKPLETQHPELALKEIVHVREVVPINWGKFFKEMLRDCDETIAWPMVIHTIQQLVEKQLGGEE